MSEDIRWKQRFASYLKALGRLIDAVNLSKTRALSELEQQGLIQAFEFTHELAWKVLKDFLEYQGILGIVGSRDATRVAFEQGLINNGAIWMEMIKSRNESSHTYNFDTAEKVVERVITTYFVEFLQLKETMEVRRR